MKERAGSARLGLFALVAVALPLPAPAEERLELSLDPSQAESVLSIAERRAAGREIAEEEWARLFATEPYLRLEKRETSMGRSFERQAFREFVLSGELAGRLPELRRTLEAWKRADLRAAAERILPYLPPEARVRAKVYPVVKPRTNSFVFEAATDPAIFLAVDPTQSESAFANTVAHELHHIGLASLSAEHERRIESLPPPARQAARWMGAFGEGLAVLAAAGSPDVHPMRDFPDEDRIRWDQDQRFFEQLVGQLDGFLLDVARGGFARPEVADRVAMGHFGYRGPWYTVGWRMGAEVERRFGRAALLECMGDPRRLLARYNEVAGAPAAAGAERLPRWSAELLAAVAAPAR